VLATYASEANKTVGMWRAVPDDLLDFKPHDKGNAIRPILVHQILSERRFFGQFGGPGVPAVDQLLAWGEEPRDGRCLEEDVWMARMRLPQLAKGTASWWLEVRPFFGGLQRERIWIFWRRVLHTCHHRTQVQTWLRLAGQHVPAIYGPSGDVKWDEADPTYSLEAAKRGGWSSRPIRSIALPPPRHPPRTPRPGPPPRPWTHAPERRDNLQETGTLHAAQAPPVRARLPGRAGRRPLASRADDARPRRNRGRAGQPAPRGRPVAVRRRRHRRGRRQRRE